MKRTARIILCIMLIMSAAVEAHSGTRLKGKLSDLYGSGTKEEEDTAPQRRILPKRGDIAVLVEGDDRQHRAMAEAMIIEELTSRGYRIVDEAKMKRIKAAAARAKAAIYALEGNVAGILSLNAHYSAAATVVARVQAGGKKLGGRVADAKIVGYSIDETMRKALYEAVKNGMQQFF